MPSDTIALVTSVIRQRATCLHCIANTASIDEAGVDAALASIGSVVKIQRHETGRCYGCGEVGRVFALDAPMH